MVFKRFMLWLCLWLLLSLVGFYLLKKTFNENKNEIKMRKNLSYELFVALERYFIEGADALKVETIGRFTDVVVGINFLPFNSDSINIKERQTIFKKYGFSSATELAEDFRKRVLNLQAPIPPHFEQEELGYAYVFISGYDTIYHRNYIFGIHSYLPEECEPYFLATYYDLDNDLTEKEREDYFKELEYFSQAKGYRWLDPETDYYPDLLAWEALEELIPEIYLLLKDKLDVKFSLEPIKEKETTAATQEDLAQFLAYCGVAQEDIDENVERLFSSLNDFEIDEEDEFSLVERGNEVAEFISEYGNAYAMDWKFDAEDLEQCVLSLSPMEDWAWEYPKNVYNADLFPSIREELYRYQNWLCHFNEGSDNYLFLLFPENQLPEIMTLAQKLQLPLRVFFR